MSMRREFILLTIIPNSALDSGFHAILMDLSKNQ